MWEAGLVVGDGDEDVEALAAVGGHGGVGGCGAVEVDAEVFRLEVVLLEESVDELLVALAEDDGVKRLERRRRGAMPLAYLGSMRCL
jgi:hypothetical protein